MNKARAFVRYALSVGALELLPKGRELRSGRLSYYFFNTALFNNGQSISVLAEAYAEAIYPVLNTVEATYGQPYKGIPLAAAVSMGVWQRYGKLIGYSFSRKEIKDHSEGGIHVGCSLKNKGVALVDDVVTSGASAGEAVAYVRAQGGHPTIFVIAFDRQERSATSPKSAVQAFTDEFSIEVRAAATLEDLIAVLSGDTEEKILRGKETLPLILAYRKEYGVVA